MVRGNRVKSESAGANSTENVYESDFVAFSLMIILAVTSGARGLKIPMILRTMAEDATRYFLVIFSSHFVLEMTLNLGRVSVNVSFFGLQLIAPIVCVTLGIGPTSSRHVSAHRPI